jgi:hypothetical protein
MPVRECTDVGKHSRALVSHPWRCGSEDSLVNFPVAIQIFLFKAVVNGAGLVSDSDPERSRFQHLWVRVLAQPTTATTLSRMPWNANS